MNSIASNSPYMDANTAHPPVIQAMYDTFAMQQAAYRKSPATSSAERIDRLKRLRRVMLDYTDRICEAVSNDFGCRSAYETKFAEIMTVIEHIDSTIKHVSSWVKPSKRSIALLHMPATGHVEYQPLGVIGIMSPWNYPLLLSVGPLISALAAGNHAMLKISSASAAFGDVLAAALAEAFPRDLVSVVCGGGIVSDTFCSLPFDLICFTGSPEIGKTVMAAAAKNLTPVLLELGGKSPAVIHESAPIAEAAERLTFAKFWNAGQTCVAPDYVLVPKGKTAEFVMEMNRFITASYPRLVRNPDYTSIASDKQYKRLQNYLTDAKEKGATLTVINPANEDFSKCRKIAPTLISNVTEDMLVAQEELFGPLFIVREYDTIDDAINFINDRPRPLALYYFDRDDDRIQYFSQHTHSGHLGINQTLSHVAQDDLPFGGIGNSGMGKYHGHEGFLTMSHGRSVMSIPKFLGLRLIFPPFGTKMQKILLRTFLR